MVTQDPTTQKPFDALADLADAYDALMLLALAEDGHSAPVPTLLANLNRQLWAFVDQVDNQGLGPAVGHRGRTTDCSPAP